MVRMASPRERIQKPSVKDSSAGKIESISKVEEFSLREIAANFISESKNYVLTRLDAFTEQVYGCIAKKYVSLMSRSAWLVGVGGMILIIGLIADQTSPAWGLIFLLIGGCSFFAGVFYFVSWRNFQYGKPPFTKTPCEAVFGEGDEDIAIRLEQLFTHLQAGTFPRPYYKKNGLEISVDPKLFYGSLRFLLLSPHKPYRELVFHHAGLPWFSHELFMRLDIKALLQQTNAKRQRPSKQAGATSHNYKRLLLLIIEHPALKQINPGDPAVKTRLMDLIKDLSDANTGDPDTTVDDDIPERSQFYVFVGEILAAIEKNRSLSV